MVLRLIYEAEAVEAKMTPDNINRNSLFMIELYPIALLPSRVNISICVGIYYI